MSKLRVADFKLRNARRMFAAGADRIEFDSATGLLTGYKTGKAETPPTEANSWDAVLPDAPK